ncbi:MAG: Hpt domain-containing protein [Desulfovibrionaceae bacterium]
MGDAHIILQRIREKFAAGAPEQLEQLRRDLAHGEFLRMAETAHYLASSAYAVQSSDLAALAKRVELAAQRGDRAETASALDAFSLKMEEVLASFPGRA